MLSRFNNLRRATSLSRFNNLRRSYHQAGTRRPGDVNRLRRSCLYVPSDNERALEKAKGLKEADVIIFDLGIL